MPEIDEAAGLFPELDGWDEPLLTRRARAAAAVQSVLADLDQRWQVPPIEFAQELARQCVQTLANQPGLLCGLARALNSVSRGQRIIDQALALGVRLRLEQGQLYASPRERVTECLRLQIEQRKLDIINALGDSA
jgi:hypothetical protein